MMGKLFQDRKLVRNPKFCRFCSNHKISILEKGHRGDCEYRNCPCDLCTKNAKKVQTSKDHRKKKDAPQTDQDISMSTESSSCGSTANETVMTLKTFIESNLDTYFEDLSRDATATIESTNSQANTSSYIQSLPIIYVDENMNEIESFGSHDASPIELKNAAVVEQQEPTRDLIVASLVTDFGIDASMLYHALLDACCGDYDEVVRRIEEAKKKYQKDEDMSS